jgi:hypothetical protein
MSQSLTKQRQDRLAKRRRTMLETVSTDELKWLIGRHGGLMGNAEAAETIGTLPPNLVKLSGLPEPVDRIRAGRIWIGCEITDFAARRRIRGDS